MDWLAERGLAVGTSGIRGLAEGFDAALCGALVQRFLRIAVEARGPVLIGHDLRASSPVIAAHCAAAAVAHGRAVGFAGAVPTPALALASGQRRAPAVMVTGSHIAGERNGLKFFIAGHEISKGDECAIAEGAVPGAAPDPVRLPPADTSVTAGYLRRYHDAFAPGALDGLRIGVFEQSSVGRDMLHEVLRGLGAATIGLARSDAFVALDTEALPPGLQEQSREWARAEGLDAIVAADGDADRPVMADENGCWLRGDRLGLLAALACGAGTVVTPLTSSSAIEASGAFNKVIRTRIGSPHVIAALMAEGLAGPVAGFEANGGFILGSDLVLAGGPLAALRTRDAVLPILLILSSMKQRGARLSALSDALPQRHTASGLIGPSVPARSAALIDRLRQDPVQAERTLAPGHGRIIALDNHDGLRCRFASGAVVHLRSSGNAPELRCYAEAGSSEEARALVTACLARISPELRPECLEARGAGVRQESAG